MSEHGEKPEVLPGDLITGPGVYMSRSNNPVEVRDCGNGYWEAAWEDGDLWYHSSGERVGACAVDDPYQLIRWVGPLAEDIPTTSEQLAEIEGQVDTVQVREGRWRTRRGDIKNIRPCEPLKGAYYVWPWTDGIKTFQDNGRHLAAVSDNDLVEYLGPIEPQPEPQPEPEKLPEGCRNDGGWSNGVNGTEPELWLVPEPEPERESDAELRIRLLKQCNDNQAETIKRLMAEARDLNMEIGGLQRQLSQRDDRIRDLETMHAAATQAVVDAGKQNDALRLQVQNRQQEHERQKSRIEFLETLNAGNGAAIDNYRALVEKLQGLVDTARGQLEAAATERDELRAAIDQADKQLDQKDAQIRDLRIELEVAQQVQQPVGDEERERIWDEATEAAGRQVVQWLRPLTLALHNQPDERFCRFMAMTLSVLPDVLPELLGYAVEDETDGDCEE